MHREFDDPVRCNITYSGATKPGRKSTSVVRVQ